MTLTVDKTVYGDACISKTVYWLSGKYVINRKNEGNNEIISVENASDMQAFKTEFFKLLNDYKLRGIIEEQTKDIRTVLYAKAFGEFDSLTQEDFI
ncbi:MAG: His-Xaa-Ser system protein HxsD [Bacteroidales bacterium]|nr:His-Xaa-Ser system protein HxsD [Bacteroidales bacterium]MBP3254760.1 His-Xaa-Ser system protein HxsD [Bacteroidales bacterium]